MRGAVWAGLGLLLAAGVLSFPVRAALPATGKAAPAWSGKTTDGKTLSSAQLKGKVVLLNFFNFY